MPFVLAPVIWAAAERPFRKQATLAERAHGDGVQVGYDSPEAFEEVAVARLLARDIPRPRIALWRPADRNPRRGILRRAHDEDRRAARRRPSAATAATSRRTTPTSRGWRSLAQMFPDATIVVPLRAPLEHAASLLRQHRDFLADAAEEPFVRRYMEDIGHLRVRRAAPPDRVPGLSRDLRRRSSAATSTTGSPTGLRPSSTSLTSTRIFASSRLNSCARARPTRSVDFVNGSGSNPAHISTRWSPNSGPPALAAATSARTRGLQANVRKPFMHGSSGRLGAVKDKVT